MSIESRAIQKAKKIIGDRNTDKPSESSLGKIKAQENTMSGFDDIGDGVEVERRSHIEQGLIFWNNKPGCKLNVYVTGSIGDDGTISPLRFKVYAIDLDMILEKYPNALFTTLIVEHEDDMKPVGA